MDVYVAREVFCLELLPVVHVDDVFHTRHILQQGLCKTRRSNPVFRLVTFLVAPRSDPYVIVDVQIARPIRQLALMT